MFASAYLKIERAQVHVQECTRLITELENSSVASVAAGLDGRGHRISHAVPGLDAKLTAIALVLGDALHNLRTALDHAWHASIIAIGLPPTDYTRFPFQKDGQQLAAVLKGINVHTAKPELFALMTDVIKPYRDGLLHLHALHHLDILDKHKLAVPVIGYSSVSGMEVEDPKTGRLVTADTYGYTYGEVLNVDILTPRVESPGQRHLSVMFGHGDFKHMSVLGGLPEFVNVTKACVSRLESATTT